MANYAEDIPQQLAAAVVQFCQSNIGYSSHLSIHGNITVIVDHTAVLALFSKNITVPGTSNEEFNQGTFTSSTSTDPKGLDYTTCVKDLQKVCLPDGETHTSQVHVKQEPSSPAPLATVDVGHIVSDLHSTLSKTSLNNNIDHYTPERMSKEELGEKNDCQFQFQLKQERHARRKQEMPKQSEIYLMSDDDSDVVIDEPPTLNTTVQCDGNLENGSSAIRKEKGFDTAQGDINHISHVSHNDNAILHTNTFTNVGHKAYLSESSQQHNSGETYQEVMNGEEPRDLSTKKLHSTSATCNTINKVHRCNHCGKKFNFFKNLASHMRFYHKGGKLLKCPTCSKQFQFAFQLAVHSKECRGRPVVFNAQDSMYPEPEKDLTKDQEASSGVLPTSYSHLGGFDASQPHLYNDTPLTSISQQQDYFSGAPIGGSTNSDPHSANMSSSLANDVYTTQTSSTAASASTDYTSSQPSYYSHKNLTNVETMLDYTTEKNPCNDTFTNWKTDQNQYLSSFFISQKKKAKGLKLYQCDICSKIFSQRCNLSRHKQIHTGKRPYKCELCGKSFNRSDVLSDHRRLVHSVMTASGDHQCPGCNKFFSSSGYLHRHRKICHLPTAV